jgi:hypothetical protein
MGSVGIFLSNYDHILKCVGMGVCSVGSRAMACLQIAVRSYGRCCPDLQFTVLYHSYLLIRLIADSSLKTNVGQVPKMKIQFSPYAGIPPTEGVQSELNISSSRQLSQSQCQASRPGCQRPLLSFVSIEHAELAQELIWTTWDLVTQINIPVSAGDRRQTIRSGSHSVHHAFL